MITTSSAFGQKNQLSRSIKTTTLSLKCLEKVFALFKAEQSKTHDTRSLHVFQLSDQCAAEFKSRNTAWMTATICKQNNIDKFCLCYAPNTGFKCCYDGAGYNRKMYCERGILRHGQVLYYAFDVMKYSYERPQPQQALHDNDPKRRKMTETNSHHYYVVDIRFK